MRPRAGDVVAERFEVEALVGVGGMGSVYRAHDRHTGEPVALKLMRERGESSSARFLLEARVLAELRHPAIVRYIAHGATPIGQLYLAMEWLDGVSLQERLELGPLSPGETLALGSRVADALATAHARGVIHRDVKPSNLFLSDSQVERTKVLDFGVARLGQSMSALSREGRRVGTPRYMAPEQVRGDRDLDARVDVFALGCVLYQALSGRFAFAGEDELEVFTRILLEDPPPLPASGPSGAPGLGHLIRRMLAKEPEARPADGMAVSVELADLATATFSTGGSPAGVDAEQRLLSVVLIAAGAPRATVRAAAQRFGAAVEEAGDGALALTLAGDKSASDQAGRGARLALELAHSTGAPLALATGRGVIARRLGAGEVMDRAAALLRAGIRGVAVDDVTAGLIGGVFDVHVSGDTRVLAGQSTAIDPERTLLGKPTPFVGRDRELGMVEAVWNECVEERVARVVLITGQPGMGKSRLRRELTARFRQHNPDATVFLGRGDPMRAGSPFTLIAPALRAAAGIIDGEPLETGERRLRRRVAATVPPAQADRVAQFLGEIMAVPFADRGDVQLAAARADTMLMGDQMRRAFEDFVAAEVRQAPVLFCLEDVHLGDLPSVKYIDAALRAAGGPLLVVALARPDVHAMFPGLWSERALTEIRMGELSRRAGESLIRAVLGEVSDETVTRLLDRAAGNAFYLEELIRAVSEGAGERLPETVLAMAQSRIEVFPADVRRMLRAASVYGESFWMSGAQAVLTDSSDGEAREWLNLLAEKEVIVQRPTARFAGEIEYVFRHALVREAAYAGFTDADRKRAHRAAGAWLESRGESDAMPLAVHFERGGEPLRAVVWYHRAAEQACEGNDFAAAIARAAQGITCGASGPLEGALRLVAAEAHRWRGQNALVVREARAAMRCLIRGETPWCTAAGSLAVTAGKMGDTDLLRDLGGELVALGGERTGARAAAAARVFVALRILGLTADAETLAPLLELAPDERARFGPAVGARVDVARSVIAASAGDVAAFLRLCESAVSGFELAGDLRGALGPRVNRGFALIELGSYAAAEGVLRETLVTSQRLGVGSVTGSALQNLGWALARLGRLAEARGVETEAVEVYRAQGARYYEGAARLYLGRVLGAADELGAAVAELHLAVDMLSVAPPLRCYAQAALAEALLADGRNAEALETARAAALALGEMGEINEGESLVRLIHARALRAAGLDAEADGAFAAAAERVLQRAARISDPALRAQFLGVVPENAATLAGAGVVPTPHVD